MQMFLERIWPLAPPNPKVIILSEGLPDVDSHEDHHMIEHPILGYQRLVGAADSQRIRWKTRHWTIGMCSRRAHSRYERRGVLVQNSSRNLR